MAVSLSNIPEGSLVKRFITSGKPGNCKFCRKFVEKLEAHHICYDPEIIIRLCHNCHHKVHFWTQRLTKEEITKMLQLRFHQQTASKILRTHKKNSESLKELIAPSKSKFVRKYQKLEIKRLKDIKGKVNKGKRLKIIIRERRRVM